MNMASNLNTLGKKAASSKMLSNLDTFVKQEMINRERCSDSLNILKASLKLAVNQSAEAKKLLSNTDQQRESYEKDFLLCQTYFIDQDYKKYYLKCIEIVTSIK